MSFKEDLDRERKYLVEDALRTLEKAKEIEADKALMEEVKAHAKEKAKQLRSIADIEVARDKAIEKEKKSDGDKELKTLKNFEENYKKRVEEASKEANKVDAEVVVMQDEANEDEPDDAA